MALDSISTVERAEADALELKNDAVQRAKALLARAEAEGKTSVEKAREAAKAEVRSYGEKLNAETSRAVEEIRNSGEQNRAAIRESACAKLPAVSEMIKERIIHG